ncbi:HIT domain-containing protein [Candidatus Wolfebacteria bacterium]|nr:HIT domain-containing protein [Candidatus Wolfebacteria bacterium]
MLYKDFLNKINSCPFCDNSNRIIINGELSYLTYALAPYHKHHLLVLPKRHIKSIDELIDEEADEIEKLQKKGLEILKKLNYKSISILVREGELNINKSIKHTHFHIIPEIRIGDLDHYGMERRILKPEEITNTVSEILSVI